MLGECDIVGDADNDGWAEGADVGEHVSWVNSTIDADPENKPI